MFASALPKYAYKKILISTSNDYKKLTNSKIKIIANSVQSKKQSHFSILNQKQVEVHYHLDNK